MDNFLTNLCNEYENKNKICSQNSSIKEKLANTLSTWEKYGQKWTDHEADYEYKLNLYTSIINQKTDQDITYICNFLERGSTIFGSSRPGNSYQYMIYRVNNDKEEYKYIHDKKNTYKKTDAKQIFMKDVHGIFDNIFRMESPDNIPNDCFDKYSARQILSKAILLEIYLKALNKDISKKGISEQPVKYPLIGIYKDEVLDKWVEIFRGKDDEVGDYTTYQKSNFIATKFWGLIKGNNADLPENPTIYDLWCMTETLWNWNTKISFDDDNKNIILYGAPGTGKTYEVDKFLKVNGIEKDCFTKVQFHPNYTYEDFIDGLRPCGVTDSGQIKFDLINGIFKDFCIKAKNNKDKKFYFIVDEINRANLNSVLGETLSILETQYRDKSDDEDNTNNTNLIETTNSKLASSLISENGDLKDKQYKVTEAKTKAKTKTYKVLFGIPDNIYFIGMMNDVDKSIDTFDLALRRRFRWINYTCDYDVINQEVFNFLYEKYNVLAGEMAGQYVAKCQNLNTYIEEELGLGTSYQFGHSFFLKITKINTANANLKNAQIKLFDEYLKPTLKEYLRAFYTEECEIEKKLNEAKDKFTKDPDSKQ